MNALKNPVYRIEHQLDYQWNFDIYQNVEDSFISNGIPSVDNLKFESVANFIVREVNLPFLKLTSEISKTGIKYYNSIEDVNEFTIQFIETSDMKVRKYFKDWMDNGIFDPYTRKFKTNIVLKEAVLSLYTTQANIVDILDKELYSEITTAKYIFKRLRMLGFDAVSLNRDGSNPLAWNITFVCDEITEELNAYG